MQKQNKTICFFNSAIEWGGGEKWHFDMALAIEKSGYDVLFFANKGSKLLEKLEGTKIKIISVQVTNQSFLNLIKINKIKNLLIRHNVNVIIINLSRDLKLAGISAKKANLKHVIYRRGSAIPIKNTFLNRYLFKNVITYIIANTLATKKTILQNNSKLFDSDKIKVIYNGIDTTNLYNQEQKSFYRKISNEFVIGNLGRIEKQKAQHYLLELALELKSRQVKNFKIIIAGKGSLEDKLKEKCEKLNLCNEVIFTGFADKVKGFYSDIDIFVLTSLWEGFGYVIAEAMAFKKPVIAFNLSSNPEIIADKITGYLVNFPDIVSMADKVEILINDEVLRVNMGQLGNKRVEELFVLENKIEEVKKFITDIN